MNNNNNNNPNQPFFSSPFAFAPGVHTPPTQPIAEVPRGTHNILPPTSTVAPPPLLPPTTQPSPLTTNPTSAPPPITPPTGGTPFFTTTTTTTPTSQPPPPWGVGSSIGGMGGMGGMGGIQKQTVPPPLAPPPTNPPPLMPPTQPQPILSAAAYNTPMTPFNSPVVDSTLSTIGGMGGMGGGVGGGGGGMYSPFSNTSMPPPPLGVSTTPQKPQSQPPPLQPPPPPPSISSQPPPLQPPPPSSSSSSQYGAPPPLTPLATVGGGGGPPLTYQSSAGGDHIAGGEQKRSDTTPTPVDILPGPSYSFLTYRTKAQTPPPPSTTNFITIDEGNCGPRYLRSSIYVVPSTPDLYKKSCIPFGCVIQPLADPKHGEQPVPIVDFGPSGPIRCTRCYSYINCHDTLIDMGRRYVCFLCQHVNSLPDGYITPMHPHRPELSFGSVEFCTTPEFIVRPPQPLTLVFVLEVSLQAVQLGLVRAFAQSIRSILRSLPDENQTRVSFITFDETIHFYQFKVGATKPNMLIIPDLEETFLPLPSQLGTLLSHYSTSKIAIDEFLISLPKMFEHTTCTKSGFGAACRAGAMVLKEHGGRVISFLAGLPSHGPGMIENRLKIEVIGTEREREYFKPQHDYYLQMSKDCLKYRIGVDLFLFANSYVDLATLLPVVKTTGGQVYYYPRFQLKRDLMKFHHELHRNISRTSGYDGVMRIRTSAGIDVAEYFGDFNLVNGTDLDVAAIHCDKTFGVSLKVEEKLNGGDDAKVGLQCALLYTTSSGDRRIRVHTLCLPASSLLTKVFSSVDQETMMYLITAKALDEVNHNSLAIIRRQLLERVINAIHSFRSFCSTKAFNPSILVLPEGLKLHPVFTVSLLKNIFFKTGKASVDLRLYYRNHIFSMSVAEFTLFIYPRMFSLHNLSNDVASPLENSNIISLPPWIRLMNKSLEPNGCYLLDNGQKLFIWLGKDVDPKFLQLIYGVGLGDEEVSSMIGGDSNNNEMAQRIKTIISYLQTSHSTFKQIATIKQGDNMEYIFLQNLVEDRVDDTMSHADLLCVIHKEVAKKFGLDK